MVRTSRRYWRRLARLSTPFWEFQLRRKRHEDREKLLEAFYSLLGVSLL